MRTVLAALDCTAAARPVLEVALGMGQLTGSEVEAVHVSDGPVDTAQGLAERLGVPFRLLGGAVEPALLEALAGPDVVAAVLGARAIPGDRRPTGHTALNVLERARKPVVVVAPEITDGSSRALHRLLLPLEGSEESSRPVLEQLLPLLVDDVELVVLHVFTPETTPRFLDRPGRDLALLSDEFLTRFCPDASHIELRSGGVARRVEELCRDESVDLVVLTWSQTMETGRAAVVRDVLMRAEVPVLLLPVVND
jgi:hypothetical protein